MENQRIHYVPLPPTIEQVTVPNHDGSVDIYINEQFEDQKATKKTNPFENDQIEKIAKRQFLEDVQDIIKDFNESERRDFLTLLTDFQKENLFLKEHSPDEEWRDIKDFKGLYQISNLGRVKITGTQKIVEQQQRQNIKKVLLCKKGRSYLLDVHSLLNDAFPPKKLLQMANQICC